MTGPREITLFLPDAEATARLAQRLAPALGHGDVIALTGPIGAGKSHFARVLIQTRLAAAGTMEDVPSPTFTLVQTYSAGDLDIWHCDLYRLTGPDEIDELGLDTAFDSALTLIEWPDRLGEDLPARALSLDLQPDRDGDARQATLSWHDPAWPDRLARLEETADAG